MLSGFDISDALIGAEVKIGGWVLYKRDLGHIIFLEVGDRRGSVQVIASHEALVDNLKSCPVSAAICVEGRIIPRGRNTNANKMNGTIEILAAAATFNTTPAASAQHSFSKSYSSLLTANMGLRNFMAMIAEARMRLGQSDFEEIPLRVFDMLSSRNHAGLMRPHSYFQQHALICETGIARYYSLVEEVYNGDLKCRLIVAHSFIERKRFTDIVADILKAVAIAITKAGPGKEPALCIKIDPDDYRTGGYSHFSIQTAGFKVGSVTEKCQLSESDPLLAFQYLFAVIDLNALLAAHTGLQNVPIGAIEPDAAQRSASDAREKLAEILNTISQDTHNAWTAKSSLIALKEKIEVIRHIQLAARKDRGSGNSLDLIDPLLEEYGMKSDDVAFIVELLPERTASLQAMEQEELFRFLWTVLGNEHVRKMMADPLAREGLRLLAQRNVIAEHKNILYLNAKTVSRLIFLLSPCAENPASLRNPLPAAWVNKVFIHHPTLFASVIYLIATEIHDVSTSDAKQEALLDAIRERFCTPFLFALYDCATAAYGDLRPIKKTLALIARKIHLNEEIVYGEIAHEFRAGLGRLPALSPVLNTRSDKEITCSIIHYLYQPVNIDYETMFYLLDDIKSGCQHFREAGIKFGGAAWSEQHRAYQIYISDSERVSVPHWLYPSKNKASFFAKASAGICTSMDLDLFERPDHFHLNMVDAAGVVIGNVQLYIYDAEGGRNLLIRAVNPTSDFVSIHNAPSLVHAVLETGLQICRASGFRRLFVAESLGVWSANSSRIEIKTVLEEISAYLQPVKLTPPLHIFRFVNKDIYLNNVFCIHV